MLLQEALLPDDQLDPNCLETEVFEREEKWADQVSSVRRELGAVR